jgi:hypothetical protein
MNIEQVLQLPKGTPVVELVAKVTNAYPERTGEGQYGAWSVMDLDIEDASGSMKAQWWDAPAHDPKTMVGRTIQVNAVESNKGVLVGAKVDVSEYNGQTTTRVKASGNGVTVQGGTPAQTAAPSTPTASMPTGVHTMPTDAPTLTELIEMTKYVIRELREDFGGDATALAAVANTATIALTNRKLVLDVLPASACVVTEHEAAPATSAQNVAPAGFDAGPPPGFEPPAMANDDVPF